METTLGRWDARGAGLGGWTLTPHHQYDPVAKTVFRGDETRQRSESTNKVIEAFAGRGGSGFRGDGGPAENARLRTARSSTPAGRQEQPPSDR